MENNQVENIDNKRIKIESDFGILFASGSSMLNTNSKNILTVIAQVLKSSSYEISVFVDGHTDNTGMVALNKLLSEARAESVADFLVKQGVLSDRITAKGHSSIQPIADNNTEEGREQNRRVDVTISLNEI
jgi:outer membrane protein OmpA-like peptidoglycan-associated protein